MKRLIFLAMASAVFCTAPVQAQAPVGAQAHLDITVETASDTGTVLIALFDSEAAYEQGSSPLRALRLDVAKGERAQTIAGLAPGTYAIRSFHDVNGNGRMDTNPFGMPSEPYAFSNNAVGNMGPAKWERARFEVSGSTSQTLILR